MTVDTFVSRMRAKEEKQWRSEGKLTRPSKTTSFDPNTDEETPDPPTLIYEGKCQVRSSKWVGSDAQAGEEEVRLQSLRAKFPVDTPVKKDDELELTVSTFDADLVGRTYRISDVLRDDWQIARVCMVEEVVS